MNQIINKKGIRLAILTMSFIQMATNAIAAILANIAATFPEASVTSIQYLMTFPNLMVVIASIVAAKLTTKVPKRTIASLGLSLAIVAGIMSYAAHGSLVLLFLWAGLLGIGIGFVVPVATSLISDYFDGDEKNTLLGYQTSAANVGSMLMTYIGSLLAVIGWYYNYLVYLLAIPGLILTLCFIPKVNAVGQTEESKGGKQKIPSFAWYYFLTAAIFMLLFYMGPTNLSMLVQEKELGSPVIAGTAATLLLLGGSIMGILFGKVAAKIGENTIPLGFVALFAGYMIIYFTKSIPALFAGSFLVGTANTLVLPQCMGQLVTEDKQQSTLLMSITFSLANLGTFFAPALTGLTRIVMQNDLVCSRFIFTAMLAIILAVVTWINTKRKNKIKK